MGISVLSKILQFIRSHFILVCAALFATALYPMELESESLILVLVVLAASVNVWSKTISPNFRRWLVVCFFYLSFYVAAAALGRDKWSHVDTVFQAIAHMLFAYWFVYKKRSLMAVFIGFGLYAAWAFGHGIADLMEGIQRPDQGHNAAVFAYFMAGICAFFFFPSFYFSGWKKWLSLVALALAFGALCFTQTRGAILALLFAAGVSTILCTQYRPKILQQCAVLGVAASVLVVFLLATGHAAGPVQSMQKRFALAGEQTTAYYENGVFRTSVGTRLLLWNLAWSDFKSKPFLGHGHLPLKKRRSLSTSKKLRYASKFNHAHNMYLETLSSHGLLGLLLTLPLFLCPLFWFFRGIRRGNLWAAMGFMYVLMFLAIGLTDVALSDRIVCVQYLFVVSLLLAAQQLVPSPRPGQ